MILISACLAGFNVRYDGDNARRELAVKLVALGQAITVCPEIMGGFQTPPATSGNLWWRWEGCFNRAGNRH